MTRRAARGARQRAATRPGAAAAAPQRRAAARGAHSCSELAVQVRAAMLNGGGAEAACGRAPPRVLAAFVRYSCATPLPSFLRCARQQQEQVVGARARRRAGCRAAPGAEARHGCDGCRRCRCAAAAHTAGDARRGVPHHLLPPPHVRPLPRLAHAARLLTQACTHAQARPTSRERCAVPELPGGGAAGAARRGGRRRGPRAAPLRRRQRRRPCRSRRPRRAQALARGGARHADARRAVHAAGAHTRPERRHCACERCSKAAKHGR
jgi:hypothetical protein